MQFSGITAHTGEVTAPVHLIHTEEEMKSCPQGSIAVLHGVKPSVHLLRHSRGLIALGGGVTSHASILAREYNIPAIVGVPEEVLEHLENGKQVLLSGDAGTVTFES